LPHNLNIELNPTNAHMKKLIGFLFVLIVVKCYAMASVEQFDLPLVLNHNDLPLEGVVSIIITIAIIYGAKIGRIHQKEGQV